MFTLLCWQETYTEIAGMQRFGAFYMDYLYTMENSSGKGIIWSTYFFLFDIICQLNCPPVFLLNVYDALYKHILHSSWLPVACSSTALCQTTPSLPPSLWEIACLVWAAATWSLTLPVLTLTPNLPGGQLSGLFSLCWHVFKFLSPHCLLKQCFPLSSYL